MAHTSTISSPLQSGSLGCSLEPEILLRGPRQVSLPGLSSFLSSLATYLPQTGPSQEQGRHVEEEAGSISTHTCVFFV